MTDTTNIWSIYLDHLWDEFFKTHNRWHPAVDARCWRNYLNYEIGVDILPNDLFVFKDDSAKESFNTKAEKYYMWKALTAS